jgi:hypothetical protein
VAPRWRALAIAPLLLAACDDPKPAAPRPGAQVPEGRGAEAQRTAEDRLRARLRAEGALTQRAVVVYRQALADNVAVCGQANPTGRGEDPFIPYVAIIAFEGDRVARADLHLAASQIEATRVYFEMVERCWDGGGPVNARSTPRVPPPAPDGLPRSEAPQSQPAPRVPEQLQTIAPGAPPSIAPMPPSGPASGTITTSSRTPVNVRSSPSGGGAVIRVVPRGSSLQVFGEAPGGWLQVGEGEPWGWLHNSMLEGR